VVRLETRFLHVSVIALQSPEKWLNTQNDQLRGEKPRDLVGTPKAPALRSLLEAINYGSFS
jgi:Protein of unknown function (DUF2384)